MRILQSTILLALALLLTGCGAYSMTSGQFSVTPAKGGTAYYMHAFGSDKNVELHVGYVDYPQVRQCPDIAFELIDYKGAPRDSFALIDGIDLFTPMIEDYSLVNGKAVWNGIFEEADLHLLSRSSAIKIGDTSYSVGVSVKRSASMLLAEWVRCKDN